MRPGGLREVYVDLAADSGRGSAPNPPLVTREGPLSTPALAEYLRRLDITLEPGWRVEINLRAVDWIRQAAQRLRRGFIILIDYGHEAPELYGVAHAGGTLTTFARHTMAGAESAPAAPWLMTPGAQDITAHVDFTTAPSHGRSRGPRDARLPRPDVLSDGTSRTTCTRFTRVHKIPSRTRRTSCTCETHVNLVNLESRLALKTLLMPGGLGSTLKVLLLGKGVGTPALRGCSYRMRVT